MADIWHAYIQHFIQRYKGSKVERVRDMFEQGLQQVVVAMSSEGCDVTAWCVM